MKNDYTVSTDEYGPFEIEIVYDTSAGNPHEEFDNLMLLWTTSDRNTIDFTDDDARSEIDQRVLDAYRGDDEVYWSECDPSRDPEELAMLIEQYMPGSVAVPAYLPNAKGVAFAPAERIRKDQLCKRITKRVRQNVRNVIEGELKGLVAWCNGEVYGYIITDRATGEHLESCWGFYDEYDYCKQSAEDAATEILAQRECERNERLAEHARIAASTATYWAGAAV